MAIDFPASPTLNQQFSAGGSTWVWDGTAWNIVPVMIDAIASDTPPTNPADGQLWWRASTGQLYVYYNDGTSKAWVQAAGSPPTLGVWEPLFSKSYTGQLINDIVKDLVAYRTLKFFLDGRAVGADVVVLAQPSTDNGSTFDGAAAFPLDQLYSANGAAPLSNTSNQTGFAVANPVPQNAVTNSGYGGEMTLQGFNTTAQLKMGHGRSAYIDNTTPTQNRVNNSWATYRGSGGAIYNALKLVQNAGTGFIGSIAILGMRG